MTVLESTRRQEGHAVPPPESEKYVYLEGRQHRWIFWLSALAALGVAVSFAGLATQSYWTLIFFLPLGVLIVEQAFALRTSTFARRVSLVDHLAAVELWEPASYPSVDVFLPTAGEDIALLKNTYMYVDRLEWRGDLNVYVLDDADRAEVRELAANHGYGYLARPGSEFKKAGNLQYAYSRSTGEHILILDADFVPRHDLLFELLPYMDDRSIGIVQSPQYFDTGKHMGWLQRSAGATQELFFRFIQPSRDAVGASICVGTSAVYRREALAAIGGFPLIGHSEDVFTGVLMAREGFSLQYVPVLVSRGECPEDLDSFIAQQYRWCEGSMSLVADNDFHDEASMTLKQRLSYWAGFLYYLSTAMNAVVAPLPILTMVWFFPRNVSALHTVPLLGVLGLWLIVFPTVSHCRWRLEVLRVQLIYGFAHLFCITDMLRGKSEDWVPTFHGAVRPPVAQRVRSFMVPYLVGTQLLVFAGLIWGLAQYGVSHYWANLLLALLQGYVVVPTVWLAMRNGRRSDAARSEESELEQLREIDLRAVESRLASELQEQR
jgi:cellulose synthase (UDP-forming)